MIKYDITIRCSCSGSVLWGQGQMVVKAAVKRKPAANDKPRAKIVKPTVQRKPAANAKQPGS